MPGWAQASLAHNHMLETIALLVLAGAILLLAEMWIPGMVAGAFGIVTWLGAVFLTYREFGLNAGHALLTALTLGGTGLLLWWMRAFPNTKFGRKWILESKVPDPIKVSTAPTLGALGESLTALRPAGTARIDGRRISVVTDGEWIERGCPVSVTRVEGSRIVVSLAANSSSG